MNTPTNSSRNDAGDSALFLLYCAAVLAVSLFHETWRDEALHWLIARDLPSIGAVFRQLTYEGTPGLYHILLYPLAKTGLPILAASALNCLFMFAAGWLLAYKSPFSKPEKMLLLWGYFMLFEYGAIARSYALSVLLLFGCAALWDRRAGRGLFLGLLLALLANTNIHGTILAIAITAGLLAEAFVLKESDQSVRSGALGTAVLACAGVAAAIMTVLPYPDAACSSSSWFFGFSADRLSQSLDSVMAAFFPVPKPVPHFWNTLLLYFFTEKAVWLSLPVLAASAFMLRRSRAALFIYLTGAFGLLAFFYVKYAGYMRHYGFVFLLFVFCLWIALREGGLCQRPRWLSCFWYAVLSAQLLGAVVAFYYEVKHPFSNAENAARYIDGTDPDHSAALTGYPGFILNSVSPYLSRGRKIVFPETMQQGTFLKVNRSYEKSCVLHFGELEGRLAAICARKCFVLLDRPLPSSRAGKFQLQVSFTGAINEEEDFYIYSYKVPYSEYQTVP